MASSSQKPENEKSAPKKATTKAATTAKSDAAKATPKNGAGASKATKETAPKATKPAAKTAAKEAAPKASAKAAPKSEAKTAKPAPQGNEAVAKRGISTKTKVIVIALAVVLLVAVVGIAVVSLLPGKQFVYATPNQTRVGFSAEYLGNVKRNVPTSTSNGGLASGYPKYGSTLSLTTEQKNAILAENSQICAGSGTYDAMDANGNLLLNGQSTGKQLYKHSAAVGMYLGDVADDEPGVVKRITMDPRGYRSYGVTGLYAPAGEVIKIEMSEADMKATGGITVHIGQALYNGQPNNIWAAKPFNRMPVVLNTMNVNTSTATLKDGVYTAYIGSFLGGPIYIRNEGVTFSATISGAVNYSHFILGYTTEEEFAQNAKSTAPYFDLEVWEYGVLHSGPKRYAQAFSFEQIYDAAVLWEKISLVSTQVSAQGIVFIYDAFVAAGAAVAFPGRQSVNCPMGWMSASLNYNGFVNSGSWGNMHEYNHNFQGGWGMGNGGEVTNNALNLVEYSLFTRISSNRKLGAAGDGMSGWNRYTSPSWSLQQTIDKSGNQLREYAALLHGFGQEAFMSTIKVQNATGAYSATPEGWYLAASDATHNNLTYLFKEVMGYNISDASVEKYSQKGYPMFAPVASIYQTGRSWVYDGETSYITTAQPYVITYGKPFVIDLRPYKAEGGIYQSGSMVLPSGLSYTVVNVSQPEHGKVEKTDENVYTYTPSKNMTSGQIVVTLKITDNSGKYTFDNMDLVLEFAQSHELNKTVLERTTYTYASDKMYTDAAKAFESNYAGYATKVEADNNNYIESMNRVVQNANAEIWGLQGATENTVMELFGKLYVPDNGNYRIALRGRKNAALYLSFDEGKTYELATKIVDGPTKAETFGSAKPQFYKDYADLQAGSWVYFKAVLIVDYGSAYLGVGFGVITPEMGVVDEDGNYQVLAAESCVMNYATAYRSTYEFATEKFATDYLYTRRYNYTYVASPTETPSVVESSGYEPNAAEFALDNILNSTGFVHSKQKVTADAPVDITVDLGETVVANKMTLYGYSRNGRVDNCGMPKDFVVSVSTDGQNFTELVARTDMAVTAFNMSFDFDQTELRYYKLHVTRTQSTNGYFALNTVGFSFARANGRVYSPDNQMFTYHKNWKVVQADATFGHLYEGKRGATVNFEFDGTALAILAPQGAEFSVTVDGKKLNSLPVKKDDGTIVVVYLSPELAEGHHKVKVTLKKGSLDSFILW